MSCIPEMRELRQVHQEFAPKGLSVVAVSIDSTPGPVRDFMKKQRINFDILLDQSSSVLQRYKETSVPVSFLITPDGSLLRFDDPVTGEITHKLDGSRSWLEEPHHSLLREFLKIK